MVAHDTPATSDALPNLVKLSGTGLPERGDPSLRFALACALMGDPAATTKAPDPSMPPGLCRLEPTDRAGCAPRLLSRNYPFEYEPRPFAVALLRLALASGWTCRGEEMSERLLGWSREFDEPIALPTAASSSPCAMPRPTSPNFRKPSMTPPNGRPQSRL
jgi:hypothetical protein